MRETIAITSTPPKVRTQFNMAAKSACKRTLSGNEKDSCEQKDELGRTQKSAPTHQEIFNWTMTAEAIASCHIKDVHELKESEKGSDFFWLGRVPCRNVRITGSVVGVTVYESRIIYAVDDGTGVIDCNHKIVVPKVKNTAGKSVTSSTSSALPELPKPVATVGDQIYAVGRVTVKYGERQLAVNQLGRCKSINEELQHYDAVRRLHKENYTLKAPFVLPEVKSHDPKPETPRRPPPQPGNVQFSLPPSSPSLSLASSPVKPDSVPPSPHKLRHPSRLRSADLTLNTFRIYLKHFMDHDRSPADPTVDDVDPFVASTPTKRTRHLDDATPRAGVSFSRTPRPSKDPISLPKASSTSHISTLQPSTRPIQGYTVSYLRRVPELVFLAKRVLRQDARSSLRKRKESKSQISSSQLAMMKPTAGDVKRLFNLAIGQLWREGSIIIWAGPKKSWRDIKKDAETSMLWKSNMSGASSMVPDASSVFGHSKSSINLDLEDEGELSDPGPNEEAYISLKVSYLADRLEEAIPKVKAAIRRRMKREDAEGYFGATPEQLARFMKQDDQWTYVRLDSIEEALEHLEAESRVWRPSKGQWDVTL